MSVVAALESSLAALDTRDTDQAAVALARAYARTLDDGEGELTKVGPLLLAVLESLGMTPKGRAAVLGKGGADGERGASRLDELRQRREARAH